MERDDLIKRLHELGFSPYTTVEDALAKTTEQTLGDMLDLYRDWHHLEPGESVLQRSLNAPRFCSLPDRMAASASICRWPFKDVRFSILQALPSLSAEQFRDAAVLACDQWNKACGIRLKWVDDPAQAHITMDVRRIDRAGGVLAESELPCGSNPRRCRQWYDTSESWAVSPSASGMAIYLVAVICHEVGHAIGLEHTNDGGLMDPTYKPGLWKPQGRQELGGAIGRYGEPSVTPVPPSSPPTTPPTGGDDYVIRVKGGAVSIDGYRLTKLVG